jgi:hypothetical protein
MQGSTRGCSPFSCIGNFQLGDHTPVPRKAHSRHASPDSLSGNHGTWVNRTGFDAASFSVDLGVYAVFSTLGLSACLFPSGERSAPPPSSHG